MVGTACSDGSAEASICEAATGSRTSLPWSAVSVELVCSAQPWRTFRWYKGQRHYSGFYWAATEGRHVVYESRLELSRLLFADFDASVTRILAQPFLLAIDDGRRIRRHVPDYLLLSNDVPTVVDVKSRQLLSRPEVSRTLEWTKVLMEQRGWRYEVWTEPDGRVLENVRFLAGFRRSALIDAELIDEMVAEDFRGETVECAMRSLPRRPVALVRAALLHLLWRQTYSFDLTRPLASRTVLQEGRRDV